MSSSEMGGEEGHGEPVEVKEEIDDGINIEDSDSCGSVQLNSCCIFCLRKVSVSVRVGGGVSKTGEGLPKAFIRKIPPGFLNTLSWVCWCVRRSGGNGVSEGVNWRQVLGMEVTENEEEGEQAPGVNSVKFWNLPKMCQRCADNVLVVDSLMNQVWKQILELRGTVMEWLCEEKQKPIDTGTRVNVNVDPTQEFFREFWGVILQEPKKSGGKCAVTSSPKTLLSSAEGITPQANTSPILASGPATPESAHDTEIKHELPQESSESSSMDGVEDEERIPKTPKKQRKPRSRLSTQHTTKKISQQAAIPRARIKKSVVPTTGGNRVPCHICGKTIMNNTGMYSHIRRAHGIKHADKHLPSMCDVCQVHVCREQIKEHLLTHVPEHCLLNCPNPGCGFTCVFPRILSAHLVVISGCRNFMESSKLSNPMTVCLECEYVAKNCLGLKGHLERQHETAIKNFPCPISGCQVSFTIRQSLNFHLWEHRDSTQLDIQACLECVDRKKINVEEMATHLTEMHGPQEIIKCTQCSFQFSSRERLVSHMYVHRNQKLICDIGGETGEIFLNHTKLARHYFEAHQIGKQFVCEHCTKSFWSQQGLKNHILSVHQQEKRDFKGMPLQCEDCGQVLKTENGLRTHKIKAHGAEPHGCKFCSEQFTQILALNQHVNKVHKGITSREFPCLEPGCEKVFATKPQLASHQFKTHGNVTSKHVCEQCGKPFRTSTDLKEHFDIVHLELKKHKCVTCGEAFKPKNSLKRHQLIHTGERPFACDICGQRFRHKEVMKTHVEGHLRKGTDFRPNGPMKQLRKRVAN